MADETEISTPDVATVESTSESEPTNEVDTSNTELDTEGNAAETETEHAQEGTQEEKLYAGKYKSVEELEKLFVENGKQPFLNDVDDVNASMDLLNSIKTGRNWGGITDVVKEIAVKPSLKAIRAYNRTGISQAVNNFSQNVSPAVRRILTLGMIKGATPMLYGGISNDEY